jgi:hypothetical protein
MFRAVFAAVRAALDAAPRDPGHAVSDGAQPP